MSISLWGRDCSWFRSCPRTLQHAVAGFRSGAAVALPPAAAAPVWAGDAPTVCTPRSPSSAATAWLLGASSGHCGVTTDPGDCESGDLGAWSLKDLVESSRGHVAWHDAAAACLSRCAKCARCRHVSVSLKHGDCSWYYACPATHASPVGFWSGALKAFTDASCAAPLPPVPVYASAAAWVRRSKPGYCGVSEEWRPRGRERRGAPACEINDAGSWSFSSLGAELGGVAVVRWGNAAAACLKRCETCARCRHLSIDLRSSECSWYASCAKLQIDPPGFRSASAVDDGSGGGGGEDGEGGPPAAGGRMVAGGGRVAPTTVVGDLDRLSRPRFRATLPRSPRRPLLVAPPSTLLLGVFSGSAARRDVVRCTWGASLGTRTGGAVRLRFVVGAKDGEAVREVGDELITPVAEGQMPHRVDEHSRAGGRHVKHGTISKQLKLFHFLRWAKEQPEPLVALADDDVFISMPKLTALSALLADEMRRDPGGGGGGPGGGAPGLRKLYVGKFEFYSWHPRTLVASGWGRTLQEAWGHALVGWRNCSPSGGGWSWDGWAMREAPPPSWDGSDGDYCQGPLAFAKGPLLLLSRPLIAEIVGSAPFERAEAASRAFASGVGLPPTAAHEHPELLLEAGSRDVLEDVQLGWWVAAVPDVRLVHLHETSVWAEGLGQVDDLGRLLVAHQVPWARLPWLTRQTDLLWKSRAAAGARQRLACLGAPCEPSTCAHDPTQRACAVVVELGRGQRLGAHGELQPQRRRRAAAGAAAGASASVSRAAAAAAATRGAAAAARGRGARARRRRSCVYVSSWVS